MSHKYANFNEAFTAFCANYNGTKTFINNAYLNGWQAYEEWANPDTKEQVYYIAVAINQLCNAMNFLFGVATPTWQDSYLHESLYWLQKEAGAVDMDAIIYAMLTAEPDEIDYFVGLVDAFRQFMWNKEFNQEFYASIARGFGL